MSRFLVLALVLGIHAAGCSSPDEAPPAAPAFEPVAPLPTHATRPWRQQVWFVARPGERVESLALDAGNGRPVVHLVSPDGTRRAVRVDQPGAAVEVQYVARPDARTSLTASTRDDTLRVAVTHDGALTLTAMDTLSGKRTVVVRDVPERRLHHPSVDPERAAIYAGETGELGGIYRFDPSARTSERIVPERNAVLPVAFRSERGERVVYVEDGDPAKVIVAEPGDGSPPRPADEFLREGRIPAALVPVVVTPEGQKLRLEGCTPEPPLAWRETHDETLRLEGHDGVGFGRGVFCGRGCTELVTGSPEGAVRVAARFEHRSEDDLWEVWFAPDLPVRGGTFVAAAKADGVLAVPACGRPLDPWTWVVTPRWHGDPGTTFTHLAFTDGTLLAHGLEGNRSFVASMLPRRPAQRQPKLERPEVPPEDVAVSPDGGTEVRVADGGIVLVERATGVQSVVLPPDPSRELSGPAFDEGGAVLWVVDRGAQPGLLRFALQKGEADRVVAALGLRRPLPFSWGDGERVAFLADRDGRAEVATARPLTPEERAAWAAGPVTLVDLVPTWLPVHETQGRLARCDASDTVEVGIDEKGGFVKWGGVRAPVWAAAFEGDRRVRLLGDRDGVPVVVAELEVNERGAVWWARALEVRRTADRWAPAEQVGSLPVEGRCIAFGR